MPDPTPIAPPAPSPAPGPDDGLLTRRAALARVAVLLGGSLSAATMAGVLAGCGGDVPAGRGAPGGAPAAAPPPAYRFQALTAEQARTVAAVAEQIIPETGTPGARSARVHEFVDRMLAEYHPAEVRERVWAGLARLDARARRRHGRAFADCTPAQQYALVDALDAQAFDAQAFEGRASAGAPADGGGGVRGGGNENAPGVAAQRGAVTRNPADAAGHSYTAAAGAPSGAADGARGADADDGPDPADAGPRAFFRTVKELTLVGYYTSEAGATRELRVNPYGRWRADVPYAELGAGWA